VSVYTELNRIDIETILQHYNLGRLISFEGIAAGIENSNFFIDVKDGQKMVRYVLTVFERMNADELPYFMRLMRFLAQKQLPCPDVMVRHDGSLLFEIGRDHDVKQGCIVSCLSGTTQEFLSMQQLAASGRAMAQLHLAGQSFPEKRPSPTGKAWLKSTVEQVVEQVRDQYGQVAYELLRQEAREQLDFEFMNLPQGVIHGDLFVDNILFEGDQVSGIIDFYYAHHESFVLDIAIALNAQAIVFGQDDSHRIHRFLEAYQSVRALNKKEKAALPMLMRVAAMRFWVSRLYDAFFTREGSMTQTKDPEEYRKKLLFCRAFALSE
jgi:homoserine kinase type II